MLAVHVGLICDMTSASAATARTGDAPLASVGPVRITLHHRWELPSFSFSFSLGRLGLELESCGQLQARCLSCFAQGSELHARNIQSTDHPSEKLSVTVMTVCLSQ